MNKVYSEVVALLRKAMTVLPWPEYQQLIAKLHATLTEEMERIK